MFARYARRGTDDVFLGRVGAGAAPGPVLPAGLYVGVDRAAGRGCAKWGDAGAAGFASRAIAGKRGSGGGGEFAGWDYNEAVDALFERNAVEEVAVEVRQGDVVFFDGVLVHRGGPILAPGSFRHALANHYIAYGLQEWPHVRWPRVGFDGGERHYPVPQAG